MVRLNKIIEYFFYLFVFLLPWQTRLIYHQGLLNGGNWEYGTFSLYGTEIILGIIFILLLIRFAIKLKAGAISLRKKILLIDLFLLSFLFYSGIAIFWSRDLAVGYNFWIGLIEAIALFYLVRGLDIKFNKLATTFVLSGLIQSGLAIYQFLTQSVFASKWLGMSSQIVTDGGVSVIEGAGRFLRAYGSFSHPNILGGWLVICLIFLMGLLFDYYKKYYQPPWQITREMFSRALFLFGSLVIIFYGIMTTFSRSAFLSFRMAVLALIICLLISKNKALLKFYAKIGFILFLSLALFNLAYGDLVFNRFVANSRLEKQSIEQRIDVIHEAELIINDNWLLGVGPGNYTVALYQMNDDKQVWEYQPVHVIYLILLAELGILGFLLLAFAIIYVIYIFIRKVRELHFQEDSWPLIVGVALAALLIIGLFDHYLWTLYIGQMLIWLIFGLFLKAIRY